MRHLLKLEQTMDYSRLGLTHNPFPSTGTVDRNTDLYFNQKGAMRALGHLIASAIGTMKSANIVITGTYGSGKSHTLRYLQSSLRSATSSSSPRPFCVYVPQPGRSPIEFTRQVFLDIGIAKLTEMARDSVAGLDDGTSVTSGSKWEEIETGNLLLAEAIRKCVPKLTELTRFPDFSRAFVGLSTPDTQFDAWSWACGERLDGGVRRRLGLSGNLTNQDAMRILVALIRILHSQALSPLVVLLDEFEAIESLSGRQKQEILFNLRWLMDQCPQGLILIVACTPEVWNPVSSQYHAFSARIGAQISLRPLRLPEVRRLVLTYLRTALKRGPARPIMHDDFVVRVFELSEGNVRRILMLCHEGVNEAARSESSIVSADHIPPWVE